MLIEHSYQEHQNIFLAGQSWNQIVGLENEADVVPNLMIGFGIDEIQAEYVAEIKLRNLNKEYILKRLADITDLRAEIADISKTSVCPLARVIRRELRNKGINHLTVVYSKEEPQNIDGERTPASSTFVPISAGVLIASKVVQDILEIK